MLNYNLNIIGGALGKFSGAVRDASVQWRFDRNIITLGTFAIAAPNTTATGITLSGATGSFDLPGTFVNDPSYYAITSITGSTCPITGSTTMSILINGDVASIQRFGEKTSNLGDYAGFILTSSFAPAADTLYEVAGLITHIRGNLSTASINWQVSGSKQSNAQFEIKKDATVTMASSSVTASNSGTFNNEFALNLTASLNGKDYIWYSSSSFKQITQSLIIPEIGIDLISYTTASYLTASWYALTDTGSYNVTASVLLKPYDPYFIDEYIIIGGGAAGGDANGAGASGGGGGAGGIVSGSGFLIQPDSRYVVTIGNGGAGGNGLAGGGGSSFVSESVFYLNAYGGGAGCGSGKGNGESGGSGGGAMGGPQQFESYSGGSTLIGTGSGTFITFGNNGGAGYAYYTSPSPGFQFELSGGGGGATGVGQNAPNNNTCGDGGAGGAGITNLMIQYTLGISGSLATGGNGGKAPGGCSGQAGEAGSNFINQYSGQGGGGARGSGVAPAYFNGGTGASGSLVFKYLGTQKGRGGTVSYDGTYTYHTFTASGIFYSTANQLPDYQ
jgi:hypothetical protein